jgi:hypothetical protein
MLAFYCGDWIQSQVTSNEIHGGRSGSGAHFSPSYLVFPANHHYILITAP